MEEPLARALIDRVESEGLAGRIRFLGYISQVDELMRRADVHICPSICEEALGNVVIEAKLAGIPSVVFASGGLPELIEDCVDGFISAEKSAAALLDAFAVYEGDRALARRQGGAARQSLGRLGVDRFAEAWRRVYDAVSRSG